MMTQVSNIQPKSPDGQDKFYFCYQGKTTWIYHLSYQRLSKSILAHAAFKEAGISLNQKRILDFAFGSGSFLLQCPLDAQLFGCELDEGWVDEGKNLFSRRGFTNVVLEAIPGGKWENVTLLKSRYDVIVCSHVLEHLEEPVTLLRSLREALIPGGYLLVLLPINETAPDPAHLHPIDDQVIHDWFSEESMKQILLWKRDTFIYHFQRMLLSNNQFARALSRGMNLCLGSLLACLGDKVWSRLDRVFALLTGSKPTQICILERKS